jgi:ubiquinone/menaquinone biosynthesis C-methylase UbiE
MVQLPASQTLATTGDGRNGSVTEVREKILDFVGPTYVLDQSYRFVDWNPTFEELIAKPLRLARGQHVKSFISGLFNVTDAVGQTLDNCENHSLFQVNIAPLTIRLENFGEVVFRKLAVQIPDGQGGIQGWSVHLFIVSAERSEELWASIVRRLEQEVTWSRYAVVYDKLLLNFPDYLDLLKIVVSQIEHAQLCLDLGAGTGNSALALLDNDPTRIVWAIESNEIMLRQFRNKVSENYRNRLHIVKDDIHKMPDFDAAFFDSATMVNTLYALDDPEACLREVNRVLKMEGTLALSTPHKGTNVDQLFVRLKEALVKKGIFESLEKAFHAARERHAAINSQIHRFTVKQLELILSDSGFQISSMFSAYVDSVKVIRATKKFDVRC